MDRTVLAALQSEIPTIRRRWEALLRVEPVRSPLGNPDTLVFLIPSSVETMLAALAKPRGRTLSLGAALRLPRGNCSCESNPYLPYFKSGEQAILETLVLIQAKLGALATRDADLAEFHAAFRAVSRREIETFCGVCTCRGAGQGCRFGKKPPLAGAAAAVPAT